MLAYVSWECPRRVTGIGTGSGIRWRPEKRSREGSPLSLGSPHVFKTTRTRVAHVRWNGKKGPSLDWVWANRGSRIHRLCHECPRTCQDTWPNPTSLASVPRRLLSFFLSSFSMSSEFLPPFRNSCPCTLSRIAAILLVSSFQFLFFHTATYFSRSSDFRFCYRTQSSTTSVSYFSLLLYILFSLSLVFGFGFVISFALCQFISSLFHFFPFLNVLSRVFHESTLFSIFPFYFFLSFASFRIFRIRFSARAFYVFRSFSRIIPALLLFVLFPLFSQPPPSLIPLFFSFSLLRRPRFTLIAHKEK